MQAEKLYRERMIARRERIANIVTTLDKRAGDLRKQKRYKESELLLDRADKVAKLLKK